MPENELESHPYLLRQIDNFKDAVQLSKYGKLIVGTFPIYAITESEPVEEMGSQLRDNWFEEAFIKYFYGSRSNHFWELFCTAFDEELPYNIFEALELLNKHQFLITDVFSHSCRLNYSPLDNHLISMVINESIIDILQNAINLNIVYFTSKATKRIFCKILQVPFINSYDSMEAILGKDLRMIILISPAGNGRAAWHFRHHFPLSQEELNNRQIGNGYAIGYRERYYKNYLTIPCD